MGAGGFSDVGTPEVVESVSRARVPVGSSVDVGIKSVVA